MSHFVDEYGVWFCRKCSFQNNEFLEYCEICASGRDHVLDNSTQLKKRSFSDFNKDDTAKSNPSKRFRFTEKSRAELLTDSIASCWLDDVEEDDDPCGDEDEDVDDADEDEYNTRSGVVDIDPEEFGPIFRRRSSVVNPLTRECDFSNLVRSECRELVVYGYFPESRAKYLSNRVSRVVYANLLVKSVADFRHRLQSAFAMIFSSQPTFDMPWERRFANEIDYFMHRGGVVVIDERNAWFLPKAIRDACRQGKVLDVERVIPEFKDDTNFFEMRMMENGGACITCSGMCQQVLDLTMIYGTLVPLAAVIRGLRDRDDYFPRDVLTPLFEAAFGISKVECGVIWDKRWALTRLFDEMLDSF